MNYLIWISVLSLVGAILMVTYRSYEVATSKQIISDSLRNRSDKKVLTFLGKNIILFNRFYYRIASKIGRVPEVAGYKTHHIWQSFSGKVDLFFERVKGKKPIHKKGAVSLYWQSVSQRKDSKN